MLILDTLLVGGLKFILSRIAEAVDTELHDESRWKEELLAAQMRLELGELTADEFAAVERAILDRLRDIRERRNEGPVTVGGDTRVTGVEATVWSDSSSTGEPPSRRSRARTEIKGVARRGSRRARSR